MTTIRAEIWCTAFVRQHNWRGNICVVAKKGDALAGQIWVEVDHLDGTSSLFIQASSTLQTSENGELLFQQRFEHAPNMAVRERVLQEEGFDPDFWLLILEDPKNQHGLALHKA